MRIRSLVHPRWVALAAVGLGVISLVGAGLASLLADPLLQAGPSAPLSTDALTNAFGAVDSDLDGLPDAVENYRAGTNPNQWNSSESPIPDGWLFKYGYNPLQPGIGHQLAAIPPASVWPAGATLQFPEEFQATLLDIYGYARPGDWKEEIQGPWNSGLDPRQWDSNGDEIPDSYLLRYGLNPLVEVADKQLAGSDGLTVRQAYQNGTSPIDADTDQDGLLDRDEIAGPANPKRIGEFFAPTNPRKYSTTNSRICDGYLVAYGLDPLDPAIANADPDRDGATTFEEFNWSVHNQPDACKTGAGLNPVKAQTSLSGLVDGWLIRMGLNPLDPTIASRATQRASTDPGPYWDSQLPDLVLTVLDEYMAGRPAAWNESSQGPWLGGSDPRMNDTDFDGVGDAWELRGYFVEVATDVGNAPPVGYVVRSNPASADSDNDGLSDFAEASGTAGKRTDAQRADTDLDGISDAAELAVLGLHPTRADSVGDLLTDGARLHFLVATESNYRSSDAYAFSGAPGLVRKITHWMPQMPGALIIAATTADALATLSGPNGDLDGDGQTNLLDPDMDNDTLLNGWEFDPQLYSRSSHGTGNFSQGRSASDPQNSDTDSDGLLDGWEINYGMPDFVLFQYNLDPARWDSDGNGISDADEDPDADGATWFSYRPTSSGMAATAHAVKMTNLDEQKAQTNPNLKSTDGDLLADGWKVFWGKVYPLLAPGVAPDIGVLYPGGPTGPLSIDPARIVPNPGFTQLDVNTVAAPLVTTRFAPLPPGTNPASLLRAYETVAGSHPLGPGGSAAIIEIRGQWPFTLQDLQSAVANPYLDDSDGDGMPDHWEWVHRTVPVVGSCLSIVGPNVATFDAQADLDKDGRTNYEEYLEKTHPLCSDTDQGGLDDGQEFALGLNPLDPRDDFFEDGRDQDGDGINDLSERLSGTNPLNPDGDGDGLLDGRNIPLSGGLPPDANQSKVFLELGIAFTATGSGSNQRFTFLGEKDLSTSPTSADPTGLGAPQGWVLVRTGSTDGAGVPAERIREGYSIGKPIWWTESRHGPWWGGALPAELGNPSSVPRNDLDNDGLGDINGEDPFPVANHYNVPRPISWLSHNLTAPSILDARNSALPPLTQRLLAQALINPMTLSNTQAFTRETAFAPLFADGNHSPRQTPTLTELTLNSTELPRGGSVILHATVRSLGVGVPGITVVASLEGQVVGAGFTDLAGRAKLNISLDASQSQAIPSHGFSLLGDWRGAPSWNVNPAAIPPGNYLLQVQTYATANTTPLTTVWPPLLSTSAQVPLAVTAVPQFTFEDPGTILTGTPVALKFRLTDASNTGLRNPVRLNLTHETSALPFSSNMETPDLAGWATFQVTIPHNNAGHITALVTSASSSGVSSGSLTTTIRALQVAKITAVLPTGNVLAGDSISITGRLTDAQGQGVPGVSVSSTLVGSKTTTTTLADGRYQIDFTVPAGVSGGTQPLLIQAAQGPRTTAVALTKTLETLASSVILIQAGPWRLGEPANFTGVLLDEKGQPFPGAKIDYHQGGAVGPAVITDSQGKFQGGLFLKQSGPARLDVSFAGDSGHRPTTTSVTRSVWSDSVLQVTPGQVARGGPALLTARLLDAIGQPVQGAAISFTWPSQPPRIGITNWNGFATVVQETTPGLGAVLVSAFYNGSLDGVMRPTVSQATWQVTAEAAFTTPATHVAGTPLTRGRLIDAGSGTGLTGQLVSITRTQGLQNRTTDLDGSFEIMEAPTRETPPTIMEIGLRFAGNAAYAGVNNTLFLQIQSVTQLQINASNLARGTHNFVKVYLSDAGGRPMNGTVSLTLGPNAVGQAVVVGGSGLAKVIIPANVSLGTNILQASYAGSASYTEANAAIGVQIVKPAKLTSTIERDSDGILHVLVHATSEGNPVARANVFLDLEGMPGGLSGVTRSDGTVQFDFSAMDEERAMTLRLESSSDRDQALATAALTPSPLQTLMPKSQLIPWAATIGGLVLLMGVVLLIARTGNPLEAALTEARARIRAKGSVEAGILAAFDELEQAAISFGWIPHRTNTPRQLQADLLARFPTSMHSDLDHLISLFEEARYGATHLSSSHQKLAHDTLERLATSAAWGRPA